MDIALQNVSLNVPMSDMRFFKDFVSKMGWDMTLRVNTIAVPKKNEYEEAMERLAGCIQLPEDFDYKKELETILTEKYL